MTGTKNAEKRHLTVLAVINNAEKSQLAAMTETNNAEKRHLAVMKETNNGAQRHLAAMAGTNGAQRHLAVMTETNERNGPRLSGEDLFSCSICYERLYRAKILNCLHTFCQLCLERHDGLGMPRSRIKQFKVISCPNCREQTVMSRGIEGLPEDSSLTKMAALLTRVNQMLQSPERSTEPTDPGQARLQLDHLQDSIRLQMSSIHAKMLKLAVVELNNLNEPQTVVLHSKSKKVRLVETEEYNPLLAKLKRIQDTLYVANSNLKSFTSVADEAIAKLSSAQLHSILEHLVKIGEEILIEQSERISACELIYKSLIPKDGEQISKIEYESDLYENVKISLKWRIGQRGSSPGMFEWPVDVAFANDQILVADKNNRRVQIFDLQGQFLQSLGENDLAPKRIVVNGQEFHVSDELGLCVKIFRNKDLADSWGEGRFTSPCGFAMDTQKDFIMSDAEMGLVSVFNREFSLTAVFKTRAPSDTSAPNPYFIATNSDDQIIVSDSYNNCIKIFAKTGQLLLTFGRGLLACPRGVCLDSEGNILVVDSDHHKVRLFDGFGQFKRDILTSSHGLSYPMGIDLREKMLVVTQCAFYGGHELKMYTFEYDE